MTKKLKKLKKKLTKSLHSTLTQVKSALTRLKKRTKSFMAGMFKLLRKMGLILLNAGILAYVILKMPEAYNLLIRSYVGDKVYIITNIRGQGGGTGFAIKADSGITYIVTNAHVCDLSTDKIHVVVKNNWGLQMNRRILKVSNKSDLCLIEGVPGVEGLSLGREPVIGTYLTSVGHPSLMPLTLSRGEFIAKEDVYIFMGFIKKTDNSNGSDSDGTIKENDAQRDSYTMRVNKGFTERDLHNILNRDDKSLQYLNETLGTISASECLAPNLININTPFGQACFMIVRGAYATNMLGQPGNSGSPVVNFWGNVVGVAFAMDQYAWVRVVSLDDLKDLLKNF